MSRDDDDLWSELDRQIKPHPRAVSALAVALNKNLKFLEITRNRERIRKDPNIPAHGNDKDFDAPRAFRKNLLLIAFLAKKAALESDRPEAYQLLASSLYRLGHFSLTLKTIEHAESLGITFFQLDELKTNAILEVGNITEVRENLPVRAKTKPLHQN